MQSPYAEKIEAEVWESLNKGDLRQAITTCERLNREFPNFASGWHTASHLALKLGNAPMALDAIREALRMDAENVTWALQEAQCLWKLGRVVEVQTRVARLLSREVTTAYEYSALGSLLTNVGDRRKALQCYKRAEALQPDDARHYFNIASLQRTLGDLGDAEASFDKAIHLNPSDFEAWKLRSELRTQTRERNHVEALENVLNMGIDDPHGKANICYALAKELEDLGESEQSFGYLQQGAGARHAHMQYDLTRDIDTMATIRDTFSAELLGRDVQGHDSAEPIFVLGMPRTGTTLVERILGSHSDVFAAGELSNFAVQMMAQVREKATSRAVSRDDLVRLTAGLDFAALGKAYVESTRPATGHTAKFSDKLPLNYLYVGLIHLALPNAKIVHVQRDPMDTIYAVYKTLFVDAYPFSYDLEELARYFVAYHELMEHWHAALPNVIQTIRYEDLVSNVDVEARRLVDACGLDWQPGCLEFYRNTDASTTASSVQIRRPVYQSSVGKWRDYEARLQPAVTVLRDAGIIDQQSNSDTGKDQWH